MSKNHLTIIHLGVDVAKLTLQLDPTHLGISQVPNTSAGLKTLLKALAKLQRTSGAQVHLLCEATSSYHRLLVDTMHREGITISVLHANRVRSFAKALGKHAKTDAIDALVLTHFGQKMMPAPTAPVPKEYSQLQALMTRRTQLVDMLVMEKNRMEGHTLPEVLKQARHTIKHLETQIAKLDAMLKSFVNQSEQLRHQTDRMCQLQGVGTTTATGLLATMPELGTLGRREIASLAGLAPQVRESGKYKGQRTIGGGRAPARRYLYMAALTASRMNPKLKALYQRLIAKGKPAKVALTAVMRQLLTVLNSLLKNPNFSLA
ncbi:MAG: IS110 family transposase [Roseimicrobium sp.]